MFRNLHAELLRYYDKKRGIRWNWSSFDSTTVKAPKGGDTAAHPTDRAKLGVKRHALTDGRGVPLSVVITEGNVRDKWLVTDALDAVMIR